jgi:hypothetical protein
MKTDLKRPLEELTFVFLTLRASEFFTDFEFMMSNDGGLFINETGNASNTAHSHWMVKQLAKKMADWESPALEEAKQTALDFIRNEMDKGGACLGDDWIGLAFDESCCAELEFKGEKPSKTAARRRQKARATELFLKAADKLKTRTFMPIKETRLV